MQIKMEYSDLVWTVKDPVFPQGQVSWHAILVMTLIFVLILPPGMIRSNWTDKLGQRRNSGVSFL